MAPSLIIKFWLKLGLGYCVFTELNVKKCLWFCDFVVWMLSVRLQERKQSLPCTVHIYLTYLSWKQARSTFNNQQSISFQISARIATAVRWMLWKWKWWSKEGWKVKGILVTTWWLLWDNLVTHLWPLGDIFGSPLVATMIEGGLRDSLIHQEDNPGPGGYGTFDADAQDLHQKVIRRKKLWIDLQNNFMQFWLL